MSLCTQCGGALTPDNTLELAGRWDGGPKRFDSVKCLLDWLRANGHEKAADDYTHGLWVLEEGIDGFPGVDG